MKKKLRKLVIEDTPYLWCLDEGYIKSELNISEYRALVEFKAYREGMKSTPLIIKFNVSENPVTGNKLTSSAHEINLNKPSYARLLIESGLSKGWDPKEQRCTIVDGLSILEEHGVETKNI